MNAIVIKVMPKSTEIDLKKIEEQAKLKLLNHKSDVISSETQDVAFGLKALMLTVMWPDEKGTDELEKIISKIKGVNSVQIVDMRRAIG